MAAQPKERTVAQGIILRFEPGVHLSDEQFFHLCQQNRDLRLERTVEGDIVVMPPAGGRSSDRNADLTMQLRQWALSEGSGVAFDSSGGFILPNGATLSPDAAWVLRSRLARLTNADFSFVTRQIGMFSCLPLSEGQAQRLRDDKGVYLLPDGRINIAGLNAHNTAPFAKAFAETR